MLKTYSLHQVVAAGNAPSVRWLQHQIRAGQVTARKLGRHWRMTDDDIVEMLENRRNERNVVAKAQAAVELSNPYGLTARSLRRRNGGRGVVA
jgi:hypothetical protein